MQEKELCKHLLGLTAPWTVSKVKSDVQSREIHVSVEQPRGTKFCCPDCQQELSCYDHRDERRWTHLDSCQFEIILEARVPRVECLEHSPRSLGTGDRRQYEAILQHWYRRVFRTNMKPTKKLAKTLKERIDNIVTYCTHGITNGVAEGINSKIMSVKRRAGGYRNIENFKKAIFFYCGGLDL